MSPSDGTQLSASQRLAMLEPPSGPVRVVFDTDTANEIDDQYALAWALQSQDRLEIEAVLAEPYSFAHHREGLLKAADELAAEDPDLPASAAIDPESAVAGGFASWARRLRDAGIDVRDIQFVDPAGGMEESYEEILRVYDKVGADADGLVFHGAPRYMSGPHDPVDSPAVRRLIELALTPSDRPLYVVAIGCVTNIASALLLAPEIRDRIVVLWTSGYPTWSPRANAESLNLVQDVAASRILFTSGVPLVYFPGYYIGAQLTLSLPDVETWVQGRGAIGEYLHQLYVNNPLHAQRGIYDHFGRTWVMWDMIDVAWLIEPTWVPSSLVRTPTLDEDLKWAEMSGSAPLMREAHGIDRDAIFRDFFSKLEKAAAS